MSIRIVNDLQPLPVTYRLWHTCSLLRFNADHKNAGPNCRLQQRFTPRGIDLLTDMFGLCCRRCSRNAFTRRL